MTASVRAFRRVGLLLAAVGWGANHFASLLQVYRVRLGLDAAAPALLFGVYALGLAPGLVLAGPLSDRYGRRAVVLPSALLALAASSALGAFGASFGALLAGRFLYGLGAGGVMSAGAAWLVEHSAHEGAATGARRATIALSSGFGLGPLVTGVLAQFAPRPTELPYLAHVTLLAAALFVARAVPNVRAPEAARGRLARVELDASGWSRFAREVAPMAPFVFAFPAIAFAALPSMLGGALGPAPLVYTGVLCGVTLAAGVLVQPLTKRFSPSAAARAGLLTGATGLVLSAVAVAFRIPLALLGVAAVLGVAYGACMTAGLEAVQRLANPEARGGITGVYYVLTYFGFAAPYLMALATRAIAPAAALLATATVAVGVALLTHAKVPREFTPTSGSNVPRPGRSSSSV